LRGLRKRDDAADGWCRPSDAGERSVHEARSAGDRRQRAQRGCCRGRWRRTALGLGTIITVAASTATADITGIVLASVFAAIGFFILPMKRQKAKEEEMRAKIADVRKRLSDALRKQFATEIQRSGDRIRESIAPYSRFIRAEGDKLKDVDRELTEITAAIAALRARIERRAA
jgi:hypothetical protein